MKFKNLKKFLATITLGAMSFGIVGCSPAGAIRTPEEFKELRKLVYKNVTPEMLSEAYDAEKNVYIAITVNFLSTCTEEELNGLEDYPNSREASLVSATGWQLHTDKISVISSLLKDIIETKTVEETATLLQSTDKETILPVSTSLILSRVENPDDLKNCAVEKPVLISLIRTTLESAGFSLTDPTLCARLDANLLTLKQLIKDQLLHAEEDLEEGKSALEKVLLTNNYAALGQTKGKHSLYYASLLALVTANPNE